MDEHEVVPSRSRWSRRRLGLGVAGLAVAGLIAWATVADLSSAGAQAPSPSPTPSGGRGTLPFPPWHGGFDHDHGPMGFGPGLGGPGVLHGVFTTVAPGGGYQTIATQDGTVTAVSSSSVTVKSDDGYSKTYAVDDNTLVHAGNQGISDVKTGNEVRITALVKNGKYNALDVFDETTIGAIRGGWGPPFPGYPPGTSQGTPASPSATA